MVLSILNPKDINILVIGDIMLDIYNYGDAQRISPEAPVPIFHSKERKYYLGGAANTFHNLCNIGVNAHLFGTIGDDRSGELIKEMVTALNPISSNYIIQQFHKPTITKERIVARSQQIVRIDTEEIGDLEGIQAELFLNAFNSLTHNPKTIIDAIIISDYGKGVICKSLMDALRHDPSFFTEKIYVDPFPKNQKFYSHSFCITPNIKELEESGGSKYLLNTLKIVNVVATEGENGITVYSKEEVGNNFHVPTQAQTVYDVSGAGDTVIAILATSYAMGFSFMDSVILANRAAGNVVSQMGTTAVDKNFIKHAIEETIHAGNYTKSSS